MARAEDSANNWLWYAISTDECTPLDRTAYPSTIFDGEPIPWPEWACRAPNGGVHLNASIGPIHIEVAARPSARDEISWTCNFQVFLVARTWIDGLADLIDESSVFLGKLHKDGEVIEDWSTIHETRPAPLQADRGRVMGCPLCGNSSTVVRGKPYFSDPAVLGRKLIVNRSGIFVREDIARERTLRTPAGAYNPARIRFREEPLDD